MTSAPASRKAGLATVGLALALLLPATGAQAAWSVQPMGGTAYAVDVAVGDGDRDGQREVYGATELGVRQWRPSGSSWVETVIDDATAYSIAVGDGDRDGKPEVYAGLDDGVIMRYAWTGSAWTASVAMDLGSAFQLETLTVGDVEGDGLKELYTSTVEGFVYKVWFKDGAWHRGVIAKGVDAASTSWIGDGDRDGGAPELFLGTYHDLVRIQRVGSVWQKTTIMKLDCCIDGVVVADADGNGKQEVYTAAWDGTVRLTWWTGGSWKNKTLTTLPDQGRDLAVGDLDGNGRPELYAGGQDGHLYRLAWSGSAWVRTDLGPANVEGDPIQNAATGDGDRDGEREVYAATLGGGMVEYDP